jgi:hypothetical protein
VSTNDRGTPGEASSSSTRSGIPSALRETGLDREHFLFFRTQISLSL